MTAVRVGTTNANKLRELREMLEPLGYEVRGIDDLDDFNVIEDGATFADNAVKKARAVVALTGEAAVADDSGLEVDALDGAPGVYAARYAGEGCSSADNRSKLLTEMGGIDDRRAAFKTVAIVVWPDGSELHVEGVCPGVITAEERGDVGFGYDAVFQPDEGGGATFAQMDSDAKNAISHRGRAFRALLEQLERR